MTYDESLGGNTIVLAKGASLEYTGTGSMIKATDKVYGAASCIIKATNSNNNIVVEGELYAAWEGQGEQDLLHGGAFRMFLVAVTTAPSSMVRFLARIEPSM